MQYVILPQGHRLTKDLPAVNESAIFAAQVVDPVLPGSVDDDGMVSGNNRMLIQRGEVNILLYGLAWSPNFILRIELDANIPRTQQIG